MRDHSLLGSWVRRFLLEHLVVERNLARNTQVSYRDTLTLLLPFVSRQAAVQIDRLAVHDVSADRVRAFLEHIEHERGCGVVTRNQRLSAIHLLAHFIGMRSPEHLAWCSEVRSVAFKKAAKTVIGYLDKLEVEVLLCTPNRRTSLGARDHPLLLFFYNSGARADEAASLRVSNLQLGTSPSVRILGKGNKWRVGAPGLSTARIELGHRGFVGMQHRAGQQLAAQRVDQRLQGHPDGADPLGQGRAAQCHPAAGIDRLLPVQRQMIKVLAHRHLRQQARGGDAAVDDRRRHRYGGDRLAV